MHKRIYPLFWQSTWSTPSTKQKTETTKKVGEHPRRLWIYIYIILWYLSTIFSSNWRIMFLFFFFAFLSFRLLLFAWILNNIATWYTWWLNWILLLLSCSSALCSFSFSCLSLISQFQFSIRPICLFALNKNVLLGFIPK